MEDFVVRKVIICAAVFFCFVMLVSACQHESSFLTTEIAANAESSANSTNTTLLSTVLQETQSSSDEKTTKKEITITEMQSERHTSPIYPDRSNPIIQHNITILTQKMTLSEDQAYRLTQTLYSLGIREITNLVVEKEEESHYEILFKDSSGETYYTGINKRGGAAGPIAVGGKDGPLINVHADRVR